MKTSKFEEILRRKFESLNPDFQAQDWNKFQAFQQHAAPSFWQTYGHWLGYAVAVITTGTMVLLYVGQSRQNDALLREMQELRAQVASGHGPAGVGSGKTGKLATAAPTVPHDTVYVVESRVVYRDRPVVDGSVGAVLLSVEERNDGQVVDSPTNLNEKSPVRETTREDSSSDVAKSTSWPETEKTNPEKKTTLNSDNEETVQSEVISSGTSDSGQVALPQGRLELGEIMPLPTLQFPDVGKSVASRRLLSRMPQPIEVRPGLVSQKESGAREKAVVKDNSFEQKKDKQQQVEKAEQIAKEESLLPKFGLNVPFRIGAGQQWEGRTKGFSLWNEVLFGENWSVQAGLNWQNLADQQFFDEKAFEKRLKQDFRRRYAGRIPPNFDIFNIVAQTSVLRIPLNVTYRGDMGSGFSYFAGGGTNLNLRAKQMLSFDYRRPSQEFGSQDFERKLDLPLLNDAIFTVGIEKRWHPIVMQVDTYVNTRLRTSVELKERTLVGLRVKLLYEFNAGQKR